MSGSTSDYRYLRIDSHKGNAESVTDPFERALLDDLFSEGDANWACIGTGEDGEPIGYSYNDFEVAVPLGVQSGQTCYLKKRVPKSYRTFHVGMDNFILPEGSAISKAASQVDGDGIIEIADTNENGVPDSGDTGLTRNGRRVDDLQLTSPVAAFEVSGRIYESDIVETPSASAPRDDGILSLLTWSLTEALRTYDVTPIEAGSALDACVAVGNSSQDYIDGRAEEAREMGAAISDNPAVAGGIAAVAGAATLHPIGRATMTGVAFLGAVYGALSMVYDRARGIHDYATGRAAEMILGRGDLESMLWMSGAGAFKGMTVTEAINAPVKVADAVAAKLASTMPRIGGGMGGGMVPAMAYASGGGGALALEAEMAMVGRLPALGSVPAAKLIPTVMAMEAAGTATAEEVSNLMKNARPLPTGSGSKIFVDRGFFPKKAHWGDSEAALGSRELMKNFKTALRRMSKKAIVVEDELETTVSMLNDSNGRIEKLTRACERIRIKNRRHFEVYRRPTKDGLAKLNAKELELAEAKAAKKALASRGDELAGKVEALGKDIDRMERRIIATEEKMNGMADIYEYAPDPEVRAKLDEALFVLADESTAILEGGSVDIKRMTEVLTVADDHYGSALNYARGEGAWESVVSKAGKSERVQRQFLLSETAIKNQYPHLVNSYKPLKKFKFHKSGEWIKDFKPVPEREAVMKDAVRKLTLSMDDSGQLIDSGGSVRKMTGHPGIWEVRFCGKGKNAYKFYAAQHEGKVHLLASEPHPPVGRGHNHAKSRLPNEAEKRLKAIKNANP